MNDEDKTRESWEQLSRRYAGRPTMFAIEGITIMTGQVIKKVLPFVILLGVYFYLNHESREADSKFRAEMEEEIQYITKDLEKTGLPRETSETIGWALRMVGRNVGFYVRDQFLFLSVFLVLLGMMFIPTSQKKKKADVVKGKVGDGSG